MELGLEDVSLLERCPHFRGCCVQASMELGPEDVSLLERCPHFRGCYVLASVVPISEIHVHVAYAMYSTYLYVHILL